jgi:hypothetical protein
VWSPTPPEPFNGDSEKNHYDQQMQRDSESMRNLLKLAAGQNTSFTSKLLAKSNAAVDFLNKERDSE